MQAILFKRHRFPADVIRHAVRLYFQFTLSIRDVEELLAERAIKVSREAVRTGHRLSLEDAPRGFKNLNDDQDEWMRAVLRPN